jgi:serine/threonine protein kinase
MRDKRGQPWIAPTFTAGVPTDATGMRVAPESRPPASEVAIGTTFGDFEVLEPLAEGGMGTVYIAEQITTGRKRALKLLRPEYVYDAESRERFLNEARISARIESDHVVEVVAAGIDPTTGTPWIAMEYLEGEDLASMVADRGALDFPAAVTLLQQVCHALGAAHRAGIVHRDIKPDNIFISASRRSITAHMVKVLDFGIAQPIARQRHSRQSGLRAIGTPLWMSPEQLDAREVPHPTSDVWALGLLAFWMLTGKSYWRAGWEYPLSVEQAIRELIEDPLEPASVRAGRMNLAGRLPRGFDRWFSRCVNRDERYRDAGLAFEGLVEENRSAMVKVDALEALLSDALGDWSKR